MAIGNIIQIVWSLIQKHHSDSMHKKSEVDIKKMMGVPHWQIHNNFLVFGDQVFLHAIWYYLQDYEIDHYLMASPFHSNDKRV